MKGTYSYNIQNPAAKEPPASNFMKQALSFSLSTRSFQHPRENCDTGNPSVVSDTPWKNLVLSNDAQGSTAVS
jgi:hypothetical protein